MAQWQKCLLCMRTRVQTLSPHIKSQWQEFMSVVLQLEAKDRQILEARWPASVAEPRREKLSLHKQGGE